MFAEHFEMQMFASLKSGRPLQIICKSGLPELRLNARDKSLLKD